FVSKNATKIHWWLNEQTLSTTLGIKTGDDYIFFKEINIFAENPVGNIDKEQILYKISVTR
ncbi:MAG: hypothetical protein J1E64_15190, partial [Acetatifactor sp.]|nr:hypothetical protein [Acetatifactor sp.]